MRTIKSCWIAKQCRKGWKLGYCIENDKPLWLRNILFVAPKDVEKALRANIVFVEMAGKS